MLRSRALVGRIFVCASLVVATCFPPPSEAGTASPDEAYDSLWRLAQSTAGVETNAQQANAIGTLYAKLFPAAAFGEEALKQYSDDDLHYLFRSAGQASLYTADPNVVQDMALAFAEMQHRSITKKFDYQQMYEAFIGARMLTEAGEFFAQYHGMDLDALPTFYEAPGIKAGEPTEWVVSPVAPELRRQPFTFDTSAQVLVVGHPLCHFSQNAVRDIFADPQLGAVFAEHAHWLAPPDQHLAVELFQQWNRDHPNAAMTIAYKRSEWPLLDYWGTPTFYFFRDGSLIAKVVGWPAEGHRDELRDALRQIGLLKFAAGGGESTTATALTEDTATIDILTQAAAEETKREKLDVLPAPIRSAAELASYLESRGPDSPLDRLSPAALKRFIDSLTFNENGVTGYRTDDLQSELTATQAYRILELFGAQHTTPLLRGLTIETKLDEAIMATKPSDSVKKDDHRS